MQLTILHEITTDYLVTMIPDHIKEQVKSAIDIVEVVSDHVKLKRSGNGFTGLCPFHNEKSPSFHVSPHLGIYKCFGCGESGDAISFVMKMEGVGFTEALRQLGHRFGIEVPEVEKPEHDEQYQLKEGIFHALAFAGKYFHKQLTQTTDGALALEYLEKRGMLRTTIRSYGLGYAPDRFDGLIKAASESNINENYLFEAGLIKYSRNGENAFDAFRHRLMFPIFNPSGRVIGFGGRVLASADGKTPKNTAKYINTSQTKVYNKSEVLYGIHVAKNEIRKHGEVILVEGYTDVLSMHQSEIKNVVATSGTALTSEQLKILHRYTDNLLMIYDADLAGQNAMSRGLELALSEGLNVRMLQLPNGEDPDSFVQKSKKQGFFEYKDAHALDFVSFLIQKAKGETSWDDPINKKKTISRILTSIARIPDEIARETFVQRLSELANMGTRALFEELNVQLSTLRKDRDRIQNRNDRNANRDRGDDGAVAVPPPRSSTSATPEMKKNQATSVDFEDPFWDLELRPGSEIGMSGEPNHDLEFERFRNSNLGNPPRKPRSDTKIPPKRPPYERDLLRLMLQHMHPMVEYVGSQCNADHFTDPDYRKLFDDLVHRYNEGLPISISVYMEREDPVPALVGEIVLDRHSTSDRVKEKLGKKINRDGNPYRTAKGEMKILKLNYLDRVKSNLQQVFNASTDQDERKVINDQLMQVSRLRIEYETKSLDDLFPDPEDV